MKDLIQKVRQHPQTRYFALFFLFLVLYKTGEHVFAYLDRSESLPGLFDLPYQWLSTWITNLSVGFYSLFFQQIRADETFVIFIGNNGVIRMEHGCTGLMQMFQIVFILAIFPLPLKNKAFFLPVSLVILFGASVIHYFILIPIAWKFNGNFEIFHDIISRAIFYCCFFLNFVLWIKTNPKPATP